MRLIEEDDLEFITKLRTSDHVQENVGNAILTNKILQKDWLLSVLKSTTDKFMVFELLENSVYKSIGMIRLSAIDFVQRSVCVGGDLLKEYSGRGYGKFLYDIIFKLCFDTWQMHRLWLLVLETNHRAIKLYQKAGFVHEGRQRKAIYKNGQYIDYLMMSILEEEYYKIQTK